MILKFYFSCAIISSFRFANSKIVVLNCRDNIFHFIIFLFSFEKNFETALCKYYALVKLHLLFVEYSAFFLQTLFQ